MTENREYCKRVAEELEAYANGDLYRCPECGEVITFNNEQYEDEGFYTCQECNAKFEENELEALSLYDYFEDILDFDFRCDSRKQYQNCRVWVTLGGPSVWIDTESGTVELRWGGDKESYCIGKDVCDSIDNYFEDLFNQL